MSAPSSNDDAMISGINVTPLVDVVLVLLVVLMVTATYISSQSIPVELPQAQTGEPLQAPLTISIDERGQHYLDGAPVAERELRERLSALPPERAGVRVVIAADGALPHRRVVQLIDWLRQERITSFALNVSPEELR